MLVIFDPSSGFLSLRGPSTWNLILIALLSDWKCACCVMLVSERVPIKCLKLRLSNKETVKDVSSRQWAELRYWFSLFYPIVNGELNTNTWAIRIRIRNCFYCSCASYPTQLIIDNGIILVTSKKTAQQITNNKHHTSYIIHHTSSNKKRTILEEYTRPYSRKFHANMRT